MKISYGPGILDFKTKLHPPVSVEDLFKSGLDCHQKGQLSEAKVFYDKCLQLNAEHADSLHLLGVIATQTGRYDVAIQLISKAISIDPFVAVYHSNLGGALRGVGKLEDAWIAYEKAIKLNPELADAQFNLAVTASELGRWSDALLAYDQALKINPKFVAALYNRGNLLNQMKRYSEALQDYDGVRLLAPDLLDVHINRGNVLQEMRCPDEALASYKVALSLNPNLANVHNNMGKVLRDLACFDEALVCYEKAIQIDHDLLDAYLNRSHVLIELKRYEQAFDSFNQVLAFKPDSAEALYGCGLALNAAKRGVQALDAYERALKLDSSVPGLMDAWLSAKMNISEWTDFGSNHQEVIDFCEKQGGVVNPFSMLWLEDDPALQNRFAKIYAENKYKLSRVEDITLAAGSAKRIKVGYYSANLSSHPVAYLMAGVFEAHDSDKFETIGFSMVSLPDDQMQQRLSSAFDHFIDISRMSTRDVVKLSREMGIDIAVDLMGYTMDGRADLFVERCAPVQVNYLGYPGTMGMDRMDYIIADQIIIPPDLQQHYTEKVVYMPHSHFVYADPPDLSDIAVSRAAQGLPETGVVFCCFNNSYKLLPTVFDSFMRVLNAVPGSVLWLAESNDTVATNLRKEAELRGVTAERLVFAGRTDRRTYLARYRLADLFLDTAPYNAGTTAADALWAGLPVLTRVGRSFASRMAAGLVTTAGLPELITQTRAEYEARAVALANDPVQLGALKTRLAQNHANSPLFDVPLFTRHLETAYVSMVGRHRAGLAPDHICVGAV